jgi:hypothetical protein
MRREWAMANADTFSVKPIGDFVRWHVNGGVSIDPFARNSRLATYTNDLNPETAAEYHLEALEFLELLVKKGVEADTIIFDPPYSIGQCKEVYASVGKEFLQKDAQTVGGWYAHKDICDKLLKRTGKFLHFGWHSNGMGKKRGFEIVDLLLVAHGRAHNDTICIAEQRPAKA